ncbi:MAG: DUF4040 domain-containing protein [Rhizobiaceae bacterium]|nr:DUF4040 domain-containing protein [Rhizobiaceae bacterium]
MTLALDLILIVLVLTVAVGTLVSRDTRSAVIAFIGLGLLLGLAWVRLSSVDVALTEVAIGGGATGILLLRACASVGSANPRRERPGTAVHVLAALFCAAVSIAIGMAVLAMPEPPGTLAPRVAEHMSASGLGNPVTVVLLVYRAFDTLLEKVVVVLSLIGVWSLATDSSWGGAPADLKQGIADGPLVLLARLLPPVGIVLGIYLVWNGADEPGGTFQGGAVLAGMWLLVQMARLRPMPQTGSLTVRRLIAVGPVSFVLVGLSGFFIADSFLAYPAGFAKPIIVAVEIALTISIAVIIGLLVAGPAARAPK